jgi:hypothetical protein
MPRIKIQTQEIIELWRYFFYDDAPDAARRDAANVFAAVAGTRNKMIAHKPDPRKPGREVTDKLLEMGQYFTGEALHFSQMYGDHLTELSIDTGEGYQVYVIPFRTQSDDERVVDTVVVLYGKHCAPVSWAFRELSEVGWARLKPQLSFN